MRKPPECEAKPLELVGDGVLAEWVQLKIAMHVRDRVQGVVDLDVLDERALAERCLSLLTARAFAVDDAAPLADRRFELGLPAERRSLPQFRLQRPKLRIGSRTHRRQAHCVCAAAFRPLEHELGIA